MVNSFAFTEPPKNYRFFVATLWGNNYLNRLADYLLIAVTEHSFSTLVPTCDQTVEILADDSIVGRLDNGGQPAAGGKSPTIGLSEGNDCP